LRELLTNHGFRDFRFLRSRDHGDFCVRIRSIAGARRDPAGLGHSDRAGWIRLSFKLGARTM